MQIITHFSIIMSANCVDFERKLKTFVILYKTYCKILAIKTQKRYDSVIGMSNDNYFMIPDLIK